MESASHLDVMRIDEWIDAELYARGVELLERIVAMWTKLSDRCRHQLHRQVIVSCFRIDHPARGGVHADAGHDPVMGYFVDVMHGDRLIASYDCFHPLFNRSRPLVGCLDFLVSEGFFSGGELQDALVLLRDGLPTPNNPRVVEIVLALERAAG